MHYWEVLLEPLLLTLVPYSALSAKAASPDEQLDGLTRQFHRQLGAQAAPPVRPELGSTAQADALMSEANMLRSRNKVHDAIELFDQVLLLDPCHTEALNCKGVCLKQLGDAAAALAGREHVRVLCVQLRVATH